MHEYFKHGEPLRAYRARLDAALFFQLGLQMGQRGSERARLRWTDVIWHCGALKIDQTKTGDEGLVFLPDDLLTLLRARKSAQVPASEWVFPSDIKRGQAVDVRALVEVVRRAARDLNIPWGLKTPGGIVSHTTRHTFTTALLDAGYDIGTVQAQTGHSDRTMLLRYSHATVKSRRAATAAVAQFVPPEVSTLATNNDSHGSHKRHTTRRRT
ncbi:MAG TPA: site-specific integrase [Pyrinomonadaceae bacterium]